MKLLLITQGLDLDDPVLSVYHGWVDAIATQFEHVSVICLKEGRHELPSHVSVHSLGKERGERSALVYAVRFLAVLWRLRGTYERVLVHMNQEYILLAGWYWVFARIPVYLWRNHYAGSWLTDTAVLFCTKVFCTSTHSYTAKYRKTVLMPVGVATERFMENMHTERAPRSLLFLARVSPSKQPEVFIDALGILIDRGVSFIASIYGSPLPEDQHYYDSLKARVEDRGLHDRVRFYPGVPNDRTPAIYQAHEVFVNTSPSGMFDKTLFEAAASGCLVLARSDDFKASAGEEFHFTDAASLAERLEVLLAYDEDRRIRARERFYALARAESLTTLADRISRELV